MKCSLYLEQGEVMVCYPNPEPELGSFIPDLTPADGPVCDTQTPDLGPVCTRRPGHAGRHAAGNTVAVVAVWPVPYVRTPRT